MKTGWILFGMTGVLGAIVIGSLIACPYDLHGASACGPFPKAGRALGFYLLYPGLSLGAMISETVRDDAHVGESLPAYLLGISIWLTTLVGAIVLLYRRMRG